MGTLKLYGYLRGTILDANSLVYLPSLGTFQMNEINILKRSNDKSQETYELVQKADPAKQQSLDIEAQYDEMNAEQTWPTEEELKEGLIINLIIIFCAFQNI
jgi:pre-rRNA-processing protein TSR1